MAQKLGEMPVYQRATEFHAAVAAIIARPAFGRNRKLRDQIAEALESILANMEEGFEQSTDAGVAKYLFTAKGSLAEVVVRLKGAQRRGWLRPAECAQCAAQGNEIGRMLGGWIKYLARCDWKDRGRFAMRDSG
jgi:four helix bundle protein